jgi:hypothetical protein
MKSSSKPGSSKFRRRLNWAAGLFVFYTVFGFLILPWIVRKVAISQLGEELGREVSIEAVRINPFAFSGSIRGLQIKDPDGVPLLRWDEAYANFQLASFFGKPWVFREVRVVSPAFRLQINPDRSLNVSDLIAKISAMASNAPAKPMKPIHFRVDRIQITNAVLSLTDLTVRNPFRRRLGPVQLNLVGLKSSPDNQNAYSVTGTTESGETFSWKGHFMLDPLGSEGVLSLQGLSIPKYSGLYDDLVRFEVRDGVISAGASYTASITPSNYVARAMNASFNLRSLKVAMKGATNNLLELDELAVDGAAADAGARTADIAAVRVVGGRVDVRRFHDGTVNLAELATPADDATNAPGSIALLMQATTNLVARLMESTNLATGILRAVDVTNCAVSWTDEANRRPVHLVVDEIAVAARNLSNLPGTNLTADVSLRWNTNGTVHVGTSLLLSPPTADISLAVTHLQLRPLDPYLETFVNLFVTGSKVGLNGRLTLRTGADGLPDVAFQGDSQLDDFAAVDAASDDLLKWRSVSVSGIDATLRPLALGVETVSITDPEVHVSIGTNAMINLLSVLKTATNASATAGPEPVATTSRSGWKRRFGRLIEDALASKTNVAGSTLLPRVTVGSVRLTNALVDFVDRSVTPAVHTTVRNVAGAVSGLTSDELKRADVRLTGAIDGTGPFEVTGKINPLHYDAQSELKVTLANMDLTPASPYSGKFAGYGISKGKLSLDLDYTITGGALKAENKITVDQFTFGPKVDSPDATQLPVRLGVAILKDRNGVISLDVPIEGRLDDPSFRLGRVIWSTLGNLLVKGVTSPFSMLGSLFGGSGEEVSFQSFSPGSAELMAAERGKLDGLVKGLYERSGLQLEIEGGYDPVVDAPVLKRRKLVRRFRREKLDETPGSGLSIDQVPFTPDEFTNRLNQAYVAILQQRQSTNDDGTVTTEVLKPTAPRSTKFEKGGTLLLQSAARSLPDVPADQLEETVLAAVILDDEDFARLAADRVHAVRDAVLASGKVEAQRVLLMDPASTESTNRAARVLFHLR